MTSPRKSISLCMIALNEEAFIERALRNVKIYVDEIIIVDGGSTDKTIKKAKRSGAKVYKHMWPNHFAKQRNISLKHATKEWILVMDADEIYEKQLLDSLQLFANNNISADMFAFPRKNFIDGKKTDAYPDRQLRFFPNNRGIKYKNKVHEQPTGYSVLVSPERMHIVHKKSSQRQEKQNAFYLELGAKEVTVIKKKSTSKDT